MPDDKVIQAIQKLFAEKMLVEVSSADEDLLETGVLDSLRLAELLVYLEEHFQLRVAMEELEIENLRSIASIARMIGQQRVPAQAGAA